MEHARRLNALYDDLVPLAVTHHGFPFEGRRVSYGSRYSGIHRGREQHGPAALTLTTAPHVEGKRPAYDDEFDPVAGTMTYHYRAGSVDQPDNRALRAAYTEQAPLIYFYGVAPSQYLVIAPVFVVHDDPVARVVRLQVGLPIADTGPQGLTSAPDVRTYAFREVRTRLHQQRFRVHVLQAYGHRCAVCALRERELVQAAHIVSDATPDGVAAVVNGLALCAIHHLAYDRNLMGIDPDGVVHIARRLRDERDGPMLREGLQGFHGAGIALPRRRDERPDPLRLEVRFREFEDEAA